MKGILIFFLLMSLFFCAQQIKEHYQDVYAKYPKVFSAVKRRQMMKCIRFAKRTHRTESFNVEAYREALMACREQYHDNAFEKYII